MIHGPGHNVQDLEKALEKARNRYIEKHPKSLAAFEDAAQSMPGGNTRTVLYHAPFPFCAASGEGAWLDDIDGHRRLNLLGEYTAGLFGHDHPAIQKAVKDALGGGISLGAHNTYEQNFAALVCQRFPSIDKVRFTNSGTEANLMALTAARAFTGRAKIMVFEGGYHGGVFLFKSGIETNAPFPWISAPYNDAEAASRLIDENATDLAAVIVEPMLGSGGCIPAEADFLQTLRQETQRTGSLLIFDEVMTSRLGAGGAQSLFDIAPDITTLGKWIGGGMSFGAFGGREDIMQLFDPRRADAISHAGTFNNNVLTMAAGAAALGDIYSPKRAETFTKWGEGVRERLNAIAQALDVQVMASGMGSIMNLHPLRGPLCNGDDAVKADDRLRELLFLELLDAGYYIARRGFIALSLALKDADMEQFFSAYEAVLKKHLDIFRPMQD